MSSPAHDLGGAVRANGTLKDASEITWAFDADESIPFPAGQISGGDAPAEMGASVRRTTHIARPSRRVLEALEAEEAARSAKHKPPCGSPRRCVSRKAAINVDDDDSNFRKVAVNVDDDDGNDACNSNSDSDINNGITTQPPTEVMSDDFEALKAMADADNQVRPSTALTSMGPSFLIPFRLRRINPRRTARPTYASCSDVTKNMSTLRQGWFSMGIGASLVGKYSCSSVSLISLTLIT
jgi:hypothetical protein